MPLEPIVAAVAPMGLNLVGAAAIAAYDAGMPEAACLGPRFPGADAVVVVGHGGGAFWVIRADRRRRAYNFVACKRAR